MKYGRYLPVDNKSSKRATAAATARCLIAVGWKAVATEKGGAGWLGCRYRLSAGTLTVLYAILSSYWEGELGGK